MKDVVAKCSLQGTVFAVLLMIINLVIPEILPFSMQAPVSIPINWLWVAISFLKYWCVSFFILFTIEAIRNK